MSLARQLRSSAQAVPTFASFFLHEATAMFFCWFAAVVHSRCRYGELAKSTAPIARTCMAGACNEASCVCIQTSKTYAPHLLPHCLLPSLFACHRSMNVFGHLLCSAWATRVNSLPVVRLLKLFSFRSRASSPNTFFFWHFWPPVTLPSAMEPCEARAGCSQSATQGAPTVVAFAHLVV